MVDHCDVPPFPPLTALIAAGLLRRDGMRVGEEPLQPGGRHLRQRPGRLGQLRAGDILWIFFKAPWWERGWCRFGGILPLGMQTHYRAFSPHPLSLLQVLFWMAVIFVAVFLLQL